MFHQTDIDKMNTCSPEGKPNGPSQILLTGIIKRQDPKASVHVRITNLFSPQR